MSLDDDILNWLANPVQREAEHYPVTVDFGDGVKRRGFITSYEPAGNSEYKLTITFTEEKEI